jgi:cytochrome c oxidase subunit II
MNPERAQSVLDAAVGSAAAVLHELGVALYIGAGLVLLVVSALAVQGVFAAPRAISTRRWIVGGGILFPVITLTALLVYSLRVGSALHAATPTTLRIEVTGKQWWWEVRYFPAGAAEAVVLANELHLPLGQAVELELLTTDVIHSFWVPSLAGKVDMIPGRSNRLVLRADQAGVFRGQCAEYCGAQHALMAFYVVVESAEDFQRWLSRETQSAAPPADAFLAEGYELFLRGGCQQCHTVRGTAAQGTLGPDLTHVGSRRSLAAGVVDNHIGTMAGWIAGAQDVKPGNLMPSSNVYTGRELRAVSAWLTSLQ